MSETKPAVKPTPSDADRLTALETHLFGPKRDAAHTMLVGETLTIPILAMDAKGNTQPLPPGDTFTVRASSAGQVTTGISAVAGGPAVVVTALSPAMDLLVIVEDARGLVSGMTRLDVLPAPPPEPVAAEEPKVDPRPVALKLDVEAAVRVEPEKPEPVAPPVPPLVPPEPVNTAPLAPSQSFEPGSTPPPGMIAPEPAPLGKPVRQG